MSGEVLFRIAAAAVALVLAGRAGHRVAAVLVGALAALAVLGPTRDVFPGAAEAGVLAGAVALLMTFGARRNFPSITEEAALAALLAGSGAAAVALVAGRHLPGAGPASLAVLCALAISTFGAESCRAAGEAGWREGLARTLGVALPALLGAAVGALAGAAGRAHASWWVVAGGLAALVLVWVPAILAESARVRIELTEEVEIGLLSAEDAAALRLPWTRRFEKDFGRTDERREYVRSALLLAAARHQQRRRKGEAERLRQLEVMTFRTRLRRTQEARAARFRRPGSGEFGSESASPEN